MSALFCSDQTIRGQTDRLVTVPCDTFCLVGYSRNTFLNAFSGIGFEVCQPVGCAQVDAGGDFVNDVEDRLGLAALGDIVVYACDNSTFESNPSALQVDSSSGLPCNYFNPDSFDGDVDPALQVCTGLEQVGEGFGDVPWVLENLFAFVGILVSALACLVILCAAVTCRQRRRAGKSVDLREAIELNEGIGCAAFGGLLVVVAATIALLVFMNGMQGFLLQSVFAVDSGRLGTVTGQLAVADEVWSFLWLGLWGLISDLVGRRAVVCSGFALCSVSLFLFPHGGSVFPGLLLVRLLFAQGGAALASMLTALLADVVAPSSLGLAAGMLGLASGTGALVAVFVFLGAIPAATCITRAYYTVAAMSASLVLFSWVALPARRAGEAPPAAKASDVTVEAGKQQPQSPMHVRALQLVRSSIGLVRERPTLLASYVAGFAARADSVVVSVYIALWVARYYADNDLCPADDSDLGSAADSTACGEELLDPERRACPSAFTTASRISGTAQAASLLLSLVVGLVASKAKDSRQLLRCLAGAALFGVFAYSLAPILDDDPTSSVAYLLAALWGTASISMIVFAQVAVAKEMAQRPELSGVIAGTYSMFGSVGIILVSYIGGFLFDQWADYAPFILVAAASAAVLAVAVAILKVTRHQGPAQEREIMSN